MSGWSTRALLTLSIVLTATGAAAAELIERNYDESFDVAPGARLELEYGDGDVTIAAWERDTVRIVVSYSARVGGWGVGERSDFEVDFRQSGRTLEVIGREPSFRGFGAVSTQEELYTYEIQAPAYVELRLEGDDGDLAIEGWRAPIRVTTEDGDVEIRDVTADRVRLALDDGDVIVAGARADVTVESSDGDLTLTDLEGPRIRLSTDDGDIDLRRARGDLEISTEDGDLTLLEIGSRRIDLRADDGDVRLELTRAADLDLLARTEDGRVEITAPASLSAALELRSDDGRIDVDAPGADLSRARREVSGRVGGGDGSIRVTTDDGTIRLRLERARRLEREDAG